MKPIAMFQSNEAWGPGALPMVLAALGRQAEVIPWAGAPLTPDMTTEFAGFVFLGGPARSHGEPPGTAQARQLIQAADAQGLPLAGHGLGCHLLAVALGGRITRGATPEMGWQPLKTADNLVARAWWGRHAAHLLESFQWHGETFQAPPDAIRIAWSRNSANQACILRDRHLLLQPHLEMTPVQIRRVLARHGRQLEQQRAGGDPADCPLREVRRDLQVRTARMSTMLSRLYARWVSHCPT